MSSYVAGKFVEKNFFFFSKKGLTNRSKYDILSKL